MTTPGERDYTSIEVDGVEYRSSPVMKVFYLLEESTSDNVAHKLFEAMKAGMHWYHEEDEIFELMGQLRIPEILEFLSGSKPAEDDEPDFPEEEAQQITDSFLMTEHPEIGGVGG